MVRAWWERNDDYSPMQAFQMLYYQYNAQKKKANKKKERKMSTYKTALRTL